MASRSSLRALSRLAIAVAAAGGCSKGDKTPPPPPPADKPAPPPVPPVIALPNPPPVKDPPPPPPSSNAVEIDCKTVHMDDGSVRLQVDIENNTQKPVHVLSRPGMPYFVLEGKRLLVLSGVNEPAPGTDLSSAEIPISRPLGPGDSMVSNIQLLPLVLRNHYDRGRSPVALPSSLDVQCRVAYGETPIGPAEAAAMSLKDLLAWQHWVDAAPVHLTPPPG